MEQQFCCLSVLDPKHCRCISWKCLCLGCRRSHHSPVGVHNPLAGLPVPGAGRCPSRSSFSQEHALRCSRSLAEGCNKPFRLAENTVLLPPHLLLSPLPLSHRAPSRAALPATRTASHCRHLFCWPRRWHPLTQRQSMVGIVLVLRKNPPCSACYYPIFFTNPTPQKKNQCPNTT